MSGAVAARLALAAALASCAAPAPPAPAAAPPARAPHVEAPCPPGALVCDDFEAYPPGDDLAPHWRTQTIGGEVRVDGSRPFRGRQGLHVTVTASPPDEPKRTHGGPLRAASIVKQGAPLFPLPGNAFHGRAMIWLVKMPPGGVHFSNFEAVGRTPDGSVVKYGEGGMFGKLMVGYTVRPHHEFDPPTIDCARTAPTGVPEGRWVCAEWQFDGPRAALHYWFDGVPQTAVDVEGGGGRCPVPWVAPVFDELYIGWRHSQPSSIPVEMWIDDVVVGPGRIGCPAKRP